MGAEVWGGLKGGIRVRVEDEENVPVVTTAWLLKKAGHFLPCPWCYPRMIESGYLLLGYASLGRVEVSWGSRGLQLVAPSVFSMSSGGLRPSQGSWDGTRKKPEPAEGQRGNRGGRNKNKRLVRHFQAFRLNLEFTPEGAFCGGRQGSARACDNNQVEGDLQK